MTVRASIRLVALASLFALVAPSCQDHERAVELDEVDTSGSSSDTRAPDALPDLGDDTDAADTLRGDVPDDVDVDVDPVVPVPGLGLYLATAGVDVPHFMAVDATGHAEARAIGPHRGAGYGRGEVELQSSWPTPDGAHLVVALRHLDRVRSTLAVLDTTARGAEPVVLGEVDDLSNEVVFGDGRLVFAAGQQLFVTGRLDSDAPGLTAITRLDEADASLVRPRWVAGADRIAFEIESRGADGQTDAHLASAALDGADASPRVLTPPDGTQQRIQHVLPDGRLVFSKQGVLHALAPDGTGAPLRLTPAGRLASVEGELDAGQALLVELRDGSSTPRQLVRVSTDGQQADAPVVLLDAVASFRGLLTDDGALLFVARTGTDTATVQRLDALDGTATPVTLAAPLSSAGSQPPYPHALTPLQDAIVVQVADRLLRIERHGDASTAPTVLFDGGASWGVAGATAQGHRTLVWRDDVDGVRRYRTVAVDGASAPLEVPTDGWGPRPAPSGLLWRRPHAETGLMTLQSDSGPIGPMGGWLPGRPGAVHVLDDGLPTVLVRLDDPATSTSQWHRIVPFAFERIHTVLTAPGPRTELVGTHAGHVLLRDPTNRLLVADGSGTATALVDVASGPWTWLPDDDGLVVVAGTGGGIDAIELRTGDTHEVLAGVSDRQIVALARAELGGEPVIVAAATFWDSTSSALLIARLDGSQATSAQVFTMDTADWPYLVEPVPGTSRVLLGLASNDTAVPHPRAVWSVDLTDGEPVVLLPDEERVAPLNLDASSIWPGAQVSPRPRASSTADGQWIALSTATSVFGVRPDGRQSHRIHHQPLGGTSALSSRVWLGPDDRTLWLLDAAQVAVARVDEADSGRILDSPHSSIGPGTSVLSGDGSAVVFVGGMPDEPSSFALFHVPVDGGAATRVGLGESPLDAPLALLPDDSAVIHSCAGPTDRRLCAWRPGEGASDLVTPADDAAERVVTFDW